MEPSPPRDGGWRSASLRGHADHALPADFAAGLAELEALASARRTVMMCRRGPRSSAARGVTCMFHF